MQPYFSLPQRQAILLIALNGLLWTFMPWFTNHNLPLDVVEQLTWGHEWQWGYYKHPFLPAWMAEVFYRALGDFGLYFLSQLAIGVTLLFVYLIGARLMDHHRALLGTLLTLGIYYFIWPTPEWNNNIAQMPFWAAAVYFLLRALQGNKAQDWIWIGLALGLGVLTKYSTGILALTFFTYLLVMPNTRHYFLTGKLWLGLVTLFVVFSPNAIWLMQHDFLPITYATDRALGEEKTGTLNLLLDLRFLGVQLLDQLPMVLLLGFGGLMARRFWTLKPSQQDPGTGIRFLLFMALAPAIIAVLISWVCGLGLRDMWGTPMWNLSGLLVAAFLRPAFIERGARMMRTFLGFILLLAGAQLFNATWIAHTSHKPARTQWPDIAMAQTVSTAWKAECQQPLRLIAGDSWLAGLIALQTPGRPSVFIDGDRSISPWVTATEDQKNGTLMVWEGDINQEPAGLKQLGAQMAVDTAKIPWPAAPIKPLVLSWSIICPNQGRVWGP